MRAIRALWILTAGAFLGMWLGALSRLPLAVHLPLNTKAETIGDIAAEQSAGQTFLAPYDGLFRVQVTLADQGRVNSGAVNFRLSSGPTASETIAVKSFPAEAVGGRAPMAFDFPPIANSAGKTYYFQIDAPAAVPGNAITAYVWPEASYEPGTAYRAGRPVPGDLVFSAYFQVGLRERMEILLDQLTAHKPFPWGDRRFYAGLVVGYLALLAVLIRNWIRSLQTDT